MSMLGLKWCFCIHANAENKWQMGIPPVKELWFTLGCLKGKNGLGMLACVLQVSLEVLTGNKRPQQRHTKSPWQGQLLPASIGD